MAQETCAPKEAKSKNKKKSKWQQDGCPARSELGERIGGGWFIFKRDPKTGRIRPSFTPFEYPSKKLATEQAHHLSKSSDGAEFAVLQVVDAVQVAS